MTKIKPDAKLIDLALRDSLKGIVLHNYSVERLAA